MTTYGEWKTKSVPNARCEQEKQRLLAEDWEVKGCVPDPDDAGKHVITYRRVFNNAG